MKREIKFRAINANNEFIYGLPYTDSANETMYFNEYSNRMCWRDENGASCNQPYKNGTLMQYTGLKDKNGKEIYEGDVFKFWLEDDMEEAGGFWWLAEVRDFKGSWRVFQIGFDYTKANEEPMLLSEYADKGEVAGNIFENPELLNEGL